MRSHLSPRPVLGTVWNKDYLAHNYLKYWLKSRLLSLPQSKEIRSDGARIMRFSWSVTSRYFQSNLKAIWSLFFSGSYAYFGLTASKLRRGRDKGSERGGDPGKETVLRLNILKIVYSGEMVQGEQKKVGQILGEVMKFCEKIAVEGKSKLKYSMSLNSWC